MTYTTISSPSNPLIKKLRKLHSQHKFRRDLQQTLAHGPHLVKSYLNVFETVEMFYFAEASTKNPEVSSLIDTLSERGAQAILLPDQLYETLSDVHAKVGISLIIPTPKTLAQSTLTTDTILLDAIQDPGNLGTILRTARATGVESVYLSADCTSAWTPKALRAGMGAQFGLAIYEQIELLTLVEQSQIPVYATTLSAKSVSLYETDLESEVAWIFGSEGRGVSPELQHLAHKSVHLPQLDTSVESLNVAAAAAVCLYERFRHKQRL